MHVGTECNDNESAEIDHSDTIDTSNCHYDIDQYNLTDVCGRLIEYLMQ